MNEEIRSIECRTNSIEKTRKVEGEDAYQSNGSVVLTEFESFTPVPALVAD
jgi:hypothetical protein